MSLMTAGLSAFGVLALLFIGWWWITNTMHGKLFWYRLYKLRALASKPVVNSSGWTSAEQTLGSDFAKFIPAMDQAQFNRFSRYLTLAGDAGRTPLPMWLMAVLVVLVAAEGLGFSYLLGTWVASEGSENLYQVLMLAIVFVLCTVLVFLTHAAGHQLYRTQLINRCRRRWQQSANQRPFKSGTVSLNDDQDRDAQDPEYTQIVNRVGDHGSYAMVITAAVAVIAIAVLSTWMRIRALERTEAEANLGRQATVAVQASGNPFAGGSATTGNPFGSSGNGGAAGLPSEVVEENNKARQLGDDTVGEARHGEGVAAFLTLAVIFIITQVVGVFAGFKWGFGGAQSKAAYQGTRGFASWSQVQEVRDVLIEPVEELMSSLHERFRAIEKLPVHTFRQYLAYKRASDQRADAPYAAAAAIPSIPATVPAAGPAPAPTSRERAYVADPVAAALSALDALGDKAAKERHLLSLPAEVRNQVVAALKDRKQQIEAARAQVQGLFD